MRAYKIYDELDMEELGDIKKGQISALLDEADASLSSDKPYGIGLYRSEEDFVEIRPVGHSGYLIWSDRLSTPRGFMGLLSRKKRIEKIIENRAQAIEAAICYMEQSRDEFEQKYR